MMARRETKRDVRQVRWLNERLFELMEVSAKVWRRAKRYPGLYSAIQTTVSTCYLEWVRSLGFDGEKAEKEIAELRAKLEERGL